MTIDLNLSETIRVLNGPYQPDELDSGYEYPGHKLAFYDEDYGDYLSHYGTGEFFVWTVDGAAMVFDHYCCQEHTLECRSCNIQSFSFNEFTAALDGCEHIQKAILYKTAVIFRQQDQGYWRKVVSEAEVHYDSSD